MSGIDQGNVRNRLLRLMSPADFALLAPHLRRYPGEKGRILFEKDAPIDAAWFMERGIGSIVTISPEGQQVESGLFGHEGFGPIPLLLGADASPQRGQVQVPGECLRIDAAAFTDAVARSATLAAILLRFAQVLSTQTAYTALANAVHSIDERLARWLLMCHDRVDGDEMVLTHEFMAVMLAVRRPSVTTALHVLEGNGFIRSERGCVIIRDRAAMEEFAGDSYGAPEREYARLIGSMTA